MAEMIGRCDGFGEATAAGRKAGPRTCLAGDPQKRALGIGVEAGEQALAVDRAASVGVASCNSEISAIASKSSAVSAVSRPLLLLTNAVRSPRPRTPNEMRPLLPDSSALVRRKAIRRRREALHCDGPKFEIRKRSVGAWRQMPIRFLTYKWASSI
jgi:hypothetical protein